MLVNLLQKQQRTEKFISTQIQHCETNMFFHQIMKSSKQTEHRTYRERERENDKWIVSKDKNMFTIILHNKKEREINIQLYMIASISQQNTLQEQ